MLVASPAITISPRLPPELISLVFEFSIWSDPYVPFKTLRDKLPDDEGVGAGSSTSEDYDPDFRTTIGLVSKASPLSKLYEHLWLTSSSSDMEADTRFNAQSLDKGRCSIRSISTY